MRQASIAMSWVAAEKASQSALAATCTTCAFGSPAPMASSAPAIENCASSIQLRRCPSQRPISGRRTRSTTGDHRNFSV